MTKEKNFSTQLTTAALYASHNGIPDNDSTYTLPNKDASLSEVDIQDHVFRTWIALEHNTKLYLGQIWQQKWSSLDNWDNYHEISSAIYSRLFIGQIEKTKLHASN